MYMPFTSDGLVFEPPFHSNKLSNDTYIIKDLNGHKIGSMETSSEQEEDEN